MVWSHLEVKGKNIVKIMFVQDLMAPWIYGLNVKINTFKCG